MRLCRLKLKREYVAIALSCSLSSLIIVAGKRVKHLSKSLEIVVQTTESSLAQAADESKQWLQKLWCQRSLSAGITDLWLEMAEKSTTAAPSGPDRLALRMLSLGAFTSPGRYVCHWKSHPTKTSLSRNITDLDYLDYFDYDDTHNVVQSELAVGFEYDNEVITVTWRESAAVQWRMEISFDSLAERVGLIHLDPSGNSLYLFIINQPKLCRGVPPQRYTPDFDDEEVVWEREVCFGSCNHSIIGASNAIRLEIDPLENGNIEGLLQRLKRHGFTTYAGNPETVQAKQNTTIQWPRFTTFEATYAWYCLITRGFKVTDQISGDVIAFLLEQEDEVLVSRLLYAIGDEFDNNLVVSLCSESLNHEWETLLQYRDIDDDNEDQQLEHLVKVRRILLTPTAVRALPAEHIVGNRVVREFDVDHFVRVVLRDEDMELLSVSGLSLAKPVKVITDFLRQDLVIGERHYHFLGSSNSQMRQHGFWMYVSDGTHTVESIRRWMGDLSHERCVATYVSRLGQFFSASKKAISVEERSKRLIPDIKQNGYCFTDGIGKISSLLSRQV